jgi:hypothetical protein
MMSGNFLRGQGALCQPIQQPQDCARRSTGKCASRELAGRKQMEYPQLNFTEIKAGRM